MGDCSDTVVVVPACGRSTRFAAAGIKGHKMLIEFSWALNDGKRAPMIEHVLKDVKNSKRLIGYNPEHAPEVGEIKGALQLRETEGQADTVAAICEELDENQSILVVNCDAGFGYSLGLFIKQCMHAASYGALVFPGNGERQYSYIDGYPEFAWAREKSPISRWAMAGAYWFSRAGDVVEAYSAQKFCQEKYAGEYYLSGLFSHMREPGVAVAMQRDQLYVWGTPEDLARDKTAVVCDNRINHLLECCR